MNSCSWLTEPLRNSRWPPLPGHFTQICYLSVRLIFARHLHCHTHRPIVMYIPAWFPGASWKRTALAWRNDFEAMCDVPYNYAKRQIVSSCGWSILPHL